MNELIRYSNFNSFFLIMNGVIYIQEDFESEKIIVKTPCLKDALENTDYDLFMGLLYADLNSLKDVVPKAKFKRKGDLLKYLIRFDNSYKELLQKYFLKYVGNSVIEKKEFLVNGQQLTPFLFEVISTIILIAGGNKPIEEINKYFDDNIKVKTENTKEEEGLSDAAKKMLQKQRELEEKVRKAKNKNKETQSISLEQIIVSLMYEFKFSQDEIKAMNYFTISWYFGYAYRLDLHKVTQVAAGNGALDKKHPYKFYL